MGVQGLGKRLRVKNVYSGGALTCKELVLVLVQTSMCVAYFLGLSS